MSETLSRRDFIKGAAVAVGGLITAVLGIPALLYLIEPGLRESSKDAWISAGKLADIPVGQPHPFSFTRVQVNGWERTATSHGGFVLRRSEDPGDVLVLNSRCTHLACTVNWSEEARAYLCPCHDAKFSIDGKVLDGPPPRPLDRYDDFQVDDDGNLLVHLLEG